MSVSQDLVSVMMPAFNAAGTISQAIDSVLQQDHQRFELIIWDDASTDDTLKVATRAAESDARIRVMGWDRNQGRAAARNAVLANATGSVIAICDSDDISLPSRFSTQLEFLQSNPNVGVLGAQIESPTGRRAITYPQSDSAIRDRFNRGRSAIPNQAAMIRTRLFSVVGEYEADCRRCQDLNWFLRAAPITSFANLPDVLVQYSRDPLEGLSREYWLENARYERYAAHHAAETLAGRAPIRFADYVRNEGRGQRAFDLLRLVVFNWRVRRGGVELK